MRLPTLVLAASILTALGSAAFAQNNTATGTTATGTTAAVPATNNNSAAPREDDRGHDWGWIGLLGLAGLGGLMRRERPHVVSTSTTTHRST